MEQKCQFLLPHVQSMVIEDLVWASRPALSHPWIFFFFFHPWIFNLSLFCFNESKGTL